MASAPASTFSSGKEKEVDLLIQNLQKDAQLVTKAVQRLADEARGFSLAVSPGRDLVANLVRNRLVLEKVKPLQSRLRYQIEKLNKALAEEEKERRRGANVSGQAEEAQDDQYDQNELDPLSFRPNLSAFNASTARSREAQAERASSRSTARQDSDSEEESSGIYRPPKTMAVSYDPDSKRKERGDESQLRGRNSALLSDLTSGLSSNPFESSSGGVGVGSSQKGRGMSKRERELKELQEYEEDNYTRLTMSKKDSKKRRRDEEDLALGGAGLSGGSNRKQGRIGAGMEEEFGDLLRGSEKNYGKKKRGRGGEDAYETLRKNHKAGLEGTLKRARGNKSSSGGAGIESMGASGRKGKTKFDRQKKDFARGRR